MEVSLRANMLMVLFMHDHFATNKELYRDRFFNLLSFCTSQANLWNDGVRDVRIHDTTGAVFSALDSLERADAKSGWRYSNAHSW
jgi:hypothetical protein